MASWFYSKAVTAKLTGAFVTAQKSYCVKLCFTLHNDYFKSFLFLKKFILF